MIYKSIPVNIVCALMITAAILLSPIYGLWLLGGMFCDWRGRGYVAR
jgi:hypothetical protein